MRSCFLPIALLLFCVPPDCYACSFESSSTRLHLVELYTSEGCDSCPPAERWMSSLLKHPELVGLEFHVDYWDSAEWRDPYSRHTFSQRQRNIATRGSGGQIYTPQIWIDGQLWNNWPKGAPPKVMATAQPIVKVHIDGEDPIRISVDSASMKPALAPKDRFYAALTENDLVQNVRGGENRGKHLRHDEVVRALASSPNSAHVVLMLKPPAKMDRNKASIVIFVQNPDSGEVELAMRKPLNECRR